MTCPFSIQKPSAPAVIAGDDDAAAHELGHVETVFDLADQLLRRLRARHHEEVGGDGDGGPPVPARNGARQSEPTAGRQIEHPALQHTRTHHVALDRRQTLGVEGEQSRV